MVLPTRTVGNELCNYLKKTQTEVSVTRQTQDGVLRLWGKSSPPMCTPKIKMPRKFLIYKAFYF